MSIITIILATIVALEHFYIFYLSYSSKISSNHVSFICNLKAVL